MLHGPKVRGLGRTATPLFRTTARLPPVTGGAWGSHPQLSRGRPIGYKNLDHLMRRLHPIMLRRRKLDVETQLLGRTVTNYLVGMYEEQRLRYDEFNAQAARLVQIAQRRPLTQQEFERLQKLLACMRMLCDTPFILDPACRMRPQGVGSAQVGEFIIVPNRATISSATVLSRTRSGRGRDGADACARVANTSHTTTDRDRSSLAEESELDRCRIQPMTSLKLSGQGRAPCGRGRQKPACHRLTTVGSMTSVQKPDFRLCLARRRETKVSCASNWP